MTRPAARAALIYGSPDDIEAAFYDALRHADIERLMDCWADDEDIVCVHPGGRRMLGMQAIRDGFTAMLETGGLQVEPTQAVRVQSLSSAVHSVVERVRVTLPDGPRDARVFATNVYHKTLVGWRMVAHHASVGGAEETPEGHVLPHVLH